ncbi:MAG TPA: hypothetical protein EYQ00_07450, partial [Dehalococcoidia bacterium]|nr:hypothetical protein [Dehalococcoidia bacterium]
MKVYDCFLFFNELDILELRLETLSDHIDYFVLHESTECFSGKAKSLIFKENSSRFKRFQDKIIHIVTPNMPPTFETSHIKSQERRWRGEEYQRSAIKNSLANCADDDIILMGDVDEIPLPMDFTALEVWDKIYRFEQLFFYYYLNVRVTYDSDSDYRWPGTKMGKYSVIKKYNMEQLRRETKGLQLILPGGWHFSKQGGYQHTITGTDPPAAQ